MYLGELKKKNALSMHANKFPKQKTKKRECIVFIVCLVYVGLIASMAYVYVCWIKEGNNEQWVNILFILLFTALSLLFSALIGMLFQKSFSVIISDYKKEKVNAIIKTIKDFNKETERDIDIDFLIISCKHKIKKGTEEKKLYLKFVYIVWGILAGLIPLMKFEISYKEIAFVIYIIIGICFLIPFIINLLSHMYFPYEKKYNELLINLYYLKEKKN
jgi:hypothetical protein